jgi:hypothetical protein
MAGYARVCRQKAEERRAQEAVAYGEAARQSADATDLGDRFR